MPLEPSVRVNGERHDDNNNDGANPNNDLEIVGVDDTDGFDDVLNAVPGVELLASFFRVDVATLLQLLALTRTLARLLSLCSALAPSSSSPPANANPEADAAPPPQRAPSLLSRAGAWLKKRVPRLRRRRRRDRARPPAGDSPDQVDAVPIPTTARADAARTRRPCKCRCCACKRARRKARARRKRIKRLTAPLRWPLRVLFPPVSRAMA